MLSYAYNKLIFGLAGAAGCMLISVFILIISDVFIRTLGLRPFEFVSAVSEYLLLYMTMFMAPWLVRTGGHVKIGSFLLYMPTRLSSILERIILFVCCVLSVVAACLAAQLGYDCWQRGLLDIRSVVIPRWLLFFPLVLGFGLCAVEFLKIIPQSGRNKETDS